MNRDRAFRDHRQTMTQRGRVRCQSSHSDTFRLLCVCVLLTCLGLTAGQAAALRGPVRGSCTSATLPAHIARPLLSDADLLPASISFASRTVLPGTDVTAKTVAASRDRSVRFIENRGQFVDTKGRVRNDIRYVADASGARLFFRDNGVSYVFAQNTTTGTASRKADAMPAMMSHFRGMAPGAGHAEPLTNMGEPQPYIPDTTILYRMDMNLVGARTDVTIRAEDALDGVNNYYLAHCPKGILGVRQYARVVYENVYDHIDLEYVAREGRMKYSFIVHPGGDVRDIRMRYDGATSLAANEDGTLRIATPLGGIDEAQPLTWQQRAHAPDALQSARQVRAAYSIHSNDITFDVAPYDHTQMLVIDPWATYFGGMQFDGMTDVAFDHNANLVVIGGTMSVDFPTASGYQITFAGTEDFVAAKFSDTGSLVWSSYLGGSNNDVPLDVAVDLHDNIFIIGCTYSSDYPVVRPHQSRYMGFCDAVVVKLLKDGIVDWSTYVGGRSEDIGYGIGTDYTGNLYICGSTVSPDFEVKSAVQPIIAGWDWFVCRLNADGSPKWSTYYGGSGHDAAYGLAVDYIGNIIVAGSCTGNQFPVVGVPRPSDLTEGLDHVAIAKFDPNGRVMLSIFLGGSQADVASSVAADSHGDIVLSGVTSSPDFPLTVSKGSNPTSVFFMKMRSDGKLSWSMIPDGYHPLGAWGWAPKSGYSKGAVTVNKDDEMVFGVDGLLAPFGFPVYNTIGIDRTPQRGNHGISIATFFPTGVPICCTVYDTNDVSFMGSITCDGTGRVAVVGETESDVFPMLSPFQQNLHGLSDGYIMYLDPCAMLAPRPTATISSSAAICEGDSVYVQFRLSGVAPFTLQYSVNDSLFTIAGITETSYYIILRPKLPTVVRVLSIRDMYGSATIQDSCRIQVESMPDRRITAEGATKFCEGGSVTLNAMGVGSYRWSTGDTTASVVIRRSGRYFVCVMSPLGCIVQSDTLPVVVFPRPTIVIKPNGPTTTCIFPDVALDAGSGYVSYRWSTGDTTRNITAKKTGYYSVLVTDSNGCTAAAGIQINIFPEVKPKIMGLLTFCIGGLTVLDAGAAYSRYRWSTGDTARSIVVMKAGLYTVTVTDANGCTGRGTVTVTEKSALTPVITGTLRLCASGSGALEADAGYATYTWSTGDTTRAITVSTPGTYKVTVTDANGCSGTTQVTVTQLAPLAPVITGATEFCRGLNTVLDAGTGYMSYRWSTGETSRTLTAMQAGTYSVTVTDTNGCTGTAQVVVTERAFAAGAITGPKVVCIASTSSYALPDSANRTYTWAVSGGSIVSGQGTSSIAVTWPTLGPAMITVIVHDAASGCSDTTSYSVITASAVVPVVTAGGATVFCPGGHVVLRANAAYTSYQWSTGEMSDSITVTSAGSYTVTVKDSNGCTGTSAPVSVTIAPQPHPLITASAHVLCIGDSAVLDAGAVYRTYAWMRDGTPTGDTVRTITVRTAGSYAVFVTNEYGCAAQSPTEVISVVSAVKPVITPNGNLLVSNAAVTYQWYRNDTLLTGETARECTATLQGAYRVRITDANGCGALSDAYFVTVSPATAEIGLQCLFTDEVAPGRMVSIPLALESSTNLLASGARRFTLQLRYTRTVLYPLGAMRIVRADGRDNIAQLTGTRAADQVSGTLLQIPFMVLLGDTAAATVRIDTLWWDDGTVRTSVNTASCAIRVRVCHEGGDRLFSSSGQIALFQNHPNPFNAQTVIDFETIENGYTDLSVIDALGRTVRTLCADALMPGKHTVTFDSAMLPSGRYMCVLRTPTVRLVRWMHLLK